MNEKPYKRILTVFLAVLMLLCFGGRKEVHAQDREDNEKTVRVGWYQSDMFQEGIADDRVKRGYCYDYLQKVSDYTNWEYEYESQLPYWKSMVPGWSMPDSKESKIPIVAMTANAFDEDKKNALDAGMNGHLSKPIEIPKLVEALRYSLFVY